MKILLIISLVSLSFLSLNAKSHNIIDSLRVETKNGKKFIIHQVEPKETLYAISRRYQVSVDDISNENPVALDGLSIGQELSIPLTVSNAPAMESPKQVNHFVDMGETLYAISKKYAVSIDELKEWNNLNSNELSVGQQLIVNLTSIDEKTPLKTLSESTTALESTKTSKYHIVVEQQTLFAISRKYGVTIEDLQSWNNIDGSNISVGQRLAVRKEVDVEDGSITIDKPFATIERGESVLTDDSDSPMIEKPQEITPIDADDVLEFNSRIVREGDLEKVFEQGMAMVIENSTDTKKYLALHRTADMGTVMKVKNMMNDLAIYVRVVGKLPDTGDNEKVLLKLSRTAYQRLGALDHQFPVEVSYIP